MPRVRERTNPLGVLLRERRRASKVGFKQLYAATGLEPETLRKWEVGETYDVPLRGVLLYAREVGITLDELVEAAIGEPFAPSGEPLSPADRHGAILESADAASSKDSERGGKSRRRRRSPPSPKQDE